MRLQVREFQQASRDEVVVEGPELEGKSYVDAYYQPRDRASTAKDGHSLCLDLVHEFACHDGTCPHRISVSHQTFPGVCWCPRTRLRVGVSLRTVAASWTFALATLCAAYASYNAHSTYDRACHRCHCVRTASHQHNRRIHQVAKHVTAISPLEPIRTQRAISDTTGPFTTPADATRH